MNPAHVRLASGTSLLLAIALGMAACGRGEAPAPPAPLDAGQVALGAERASTLDAPYRLAFQWSLTEPGMRLRGEGVARIEPPYRARLDLFTSGGERIVAAALVNDDLRVPAGVGVALPPPSLLWGALGVFRPGDVAALAGGRLHGDRETELTYRFPGGDELVYRLRTSRIQTMQLQGSGREREEVRLVREDGERFPREATYRHLAQVRELKITLEQVEHVESYPSDIWDPRR